MTADWYRAAGSAADDGFPVSISPESAGWGFSGLRVVDLAPGRSRALDTGDDEVIVLPLAGSCTVEAAGERGRSRRPFERVQRRHRLRLCATRHGADDRSTDGGRFALASARARLRLPFRHVRGQEVPVELRGAGSCSRQVNNFGMPDVLDADRLIACEVLTPSGNFSSYPPHKHDEERPGEETSARGDLLLRGRRGEQAWPTSASTARTDVLAEVRTGDVVLIPQRLARPVDGHARLRPLLPERDGRAGRAGLAHLRRPGPRLGPGHLGRSADRPAAADDAGIDMKANHRRGALRAPVGTCKCPPGAKVTAHEVNRECLRMRLTVGQAVVRFLAAQRTERDGVEHKLVRGLLRNLRSRQRGRPRPGVARSRTRRRRVRCTTGRPATSRAWCTRRPAFARMRNRLSTLACTSSIGPGATNMVTGAALATDQPAARPAAARRHLRHPGRQPGAAAARGSARSGDVSVNDALRPVSRYFDRIWRPEQLPSRAARRDAGADRPGRDRCGHPRAAAGRAGAGVRLARRAVRAAHLARRSRRCPSRPRWPVRSRLLRRRRTAADRGRWRGHLLRGDRRRCAQFAEAHRHPGRGDAGRQGLAALRPPARRSARSARPAPPPPTRSPVRPTSCSASAPGGATSPPRRAASSPPPGSASSTSTSLRSTRSSTPGSRWSPTRRQRCTALTGGAGRLRAPRRLPRSRPRAWPPTGTRRSRQAYHLGHTPLPAQSEVTRRRQRRLRAARRGRLRGRFDAGRPAQAVAHPGPEGLPRRIRLLVHGLRDRRRPRARSWPHPTATCSCSSATAPT